MTHRLRYGRERGEQERNFKDSELAMVEEIEEHEWFFGELKTAKEMEEDDAWDRHDDFRSWEGYDGPRSFDWFDDCYYIEGEYHEYQDDGPVERIDLAFEAMENDLSKLQKNAGVDFKVEVAQYQLRADEILTDWENQEQTMRRLHLERLDKAA